MPRPVHLLLTDDSDAPLTTAAPVFVDYRDRSGNARTPPTGPAHIGGGLYVFTPSAADEAIGTAYLIDNGAGANPRRSYGAVQDGRGFDVFLVEDSAGDLWAGAAPTVGSYYSSAGTPRTPPALVAVAGAYLYSLTPTAADSVVSTAYRIDGPAGSTQSYWFGVFSDAFAAPQAASSQVDPAGAFVAAFRDHLTATLPAAVAVVNARRAAVLKSVPGPFTITSGMSLLLDTSREGLGTSVALPAGASVVAASVAAAITSAAPPGLTATSDEAGRVVVTAAPPSTTAYSSVVLLADAGVPSGGNEALGWSDAGEYVLVSPLRAPTWRGVCDGWPASVPDMGQGFWVLVDDRQAKPVGESSLRRDSWLVTATVHLLKPELGGSPHRTREGVTSAAAAVTEALLSTAGRQLGRSAYNDVQRVEVMGLQVGGRPINFTELPNVLHDVATLTVTARVHQRPASSG